MKCSNSTTRGKETWDADVISAMVWGDVLLEQLAMSVGITEPLALDLYEVKVIVYDCHIRKLVAERTNRLSPKTTATTLCTL